MRISNACTPIFLNACISCIMYVYNIMYTLNKITYCVKENDIMEQVWSIAFLVYCLPVIHIKSHLGVAFLTFFYLQFFLLNLWKWLQRFNRSRAHFLMKKKFQNKTQLFQFLVAQVSPNFLLSLFFSLFGLIFVLFNFLLVKSHQKKNGISSFLIIWFLLWSQI